MFLTVLACLILCVPVVVLAANIKNKFIRKIGENLLKKFKYGIFLTFWIQTIFELTLNSICGLMFTEFAGLVQIVDAFICMFILVSEVGCSILLVNLIITRINLKDPIEIEEFNQQFGVFFEEFEYNGLSTCYFYLIFMARRYALVILVLILPYPVLQIMISFIFSISVIFIQLVIYLYVTKPFIDKTNGFYIMINEILTSIFYLLIGLEYYSGYNMNSSVKGQFSMLIVILALGINILISMITISLKIWNVIKSRWRQRNTQKILPTYYDFEAGSSESNKPARKEEEIYDKNLSNPKIIVTSID